jgi:hypothetical protein
MWRVVWVAVIALVWCAAPALAQTGSPNNVVVVGADVNDDPDVVFTDDLQDGIVEAIRRSRSGVGRVIVLVQDDASPYLPISIPADANIEVRGVHVDDPANPAPPATLPELRNPSSIVVEGIDVAAVTIHTDVDPDYVPGDESAYEGGDTELLVLDGFSVTGGNNGVFIDQLGDAAVGTETLMPVLNRLYIYKNNGMIANEGNGIRTQGLCEPSVINCSIWGNGDRTDNDDEGAGISIGDTGTLFALHNTILLNENYGIHFEGISSGTVRNTIVYRNGDEEEQIALLKDGGIVADNDPFIDPNSGPLQGGITVEIFGDFGDANDLEVFFGPPDMPGTSAGVPSAIAGGISVTLPPAYLDVPGPVDVYVRNTVSDPFQIRVPEAFTYINDAGEAPIVSRVDPEWGREIGGNYVSVFGVGFEPDCDVQFDFRAPPGPSTTDATELSDQVVFISSGELRVKVPEDVSGLAIVGAPNKVEVYVHNTETGENSVATTPLDYEYRDMGGAPRPSIVQISPNYFRDVEGSVPPTTDIITSDILVWNLEPIDADLANPVVKIGGIVVEYGDDDPLTPGVILVGSFFTPQPDLGSEGGYLYEIVHVRIPVSQFGAGGAYDVTVINPNGLSDTLNAGFTYYADGAPRPDPSGREWRPANFIRFNVGGASQPRQLLGTAFDTTLQFDLTSIPGGDILAPFTAEPVELAPPLGAIHQQHTQRIIDFIFPPDPTDGGNTLGFATGANRAMSVVVSQSLDSDGVGTVTSPTATSNFYWTVDAIPAAASIDGLFFSINESATLIEPLAGPNGRDLITIDVRNWADAMLVFVGGNQVTDFAPGGVSIGSVPNFEASLPILSTLVTFEAPVPDSGIVGPVDIVIALPVDAMDEAGPNNINLTTAELYYVAEKAYSYYRADAEAGGVYPRTIPQNTLAIVGPPALPARPIRVMGSDFIGPFTGIPGSVPGNEFGTTPYTRVILDSGALGVSNQPDVTDVDVTDVMVNDPIQTDAYYSVNSFMEIEFTVDLTALVGVTLPAAGTPLAVHLEYFDPNNPTPIGAPSVGVTTTLLEAVIISTGPPEITEVLRTDDPMPGSRRDGPVRGGWAVTISGHNFGADPVVRVGGEQANVVGFSSPGFPVPDEIDIIVPPAPDLLAGIYPVIVIRSEDDEQGISPPEKDITYFLDGAPEIIEIVPNHIEYRSDPDDTDPRYITILGQNFSDIVQIHFRGATPLSMDHYSVSPTEIVVKVPVGFETDSILSTPPGGVSPAIPVVVQNIASSGAADASFESNAENIYIFDDASGMEPNVFILEFNNVFFNSHDYVMVQPGTGSISIDPQFDPTDAPADPGLPGPKIIITPEDPWVGKLGERGFTQNFQGDNTGYENPMIDKAGEFTFSPFTLLDFELDERPDFQSDPDRIHGTGPALSSRSQGLPDIGADEIFSVDASAAQVGWNLAVPIPNPVPALAAGDLTILVGFRAVEQLLVDPSVSGTFFIVPQGGDPTDDADRRAMSLVRDLGGGQYIISNDDAIETVLINRVSTAGPDTGDLIADGHAAVYVQPDPAEPLFLLGDDWQNLQDGISTTAGTNTSILGTFDNVIIDQALLGRHFIIDTIPPRANLNSTLLVTAGAVESTEVVLESNDTFDLSTLASPIHPTIPTGILTDGSPWYPAVVWTPLDQFQTVAPVAVPSTDFGLVYPSMPGPSSTSVFFNPLSFANLTGGSDLQFRVAIEFEDPYVVDSSNTEVLGFDFYTQTDESRQVSGFDPTTISQSAADGDINVLNGPVRWDVIRGAQLLLDSVATPVRISNGFDISGANPGVFDLSFQPDQAMSNPPDITANDLNGNSLVTARWGGDGGETTPIVFEDPIEHLDAALFGAFNLSIQFDGEDLAGNDSSDDDENTLLNPLNVYWYRDVNSRIAGITDDPFNTISNPLPTFSLIRDGDPSPAPDGGPTPIYSYRLWQSNDLAVDTGLAEDFQHYESIGGWKPWSGDETITTISSDLLGFPDRAILLVVHGADEAGNVEPWDLDIEGFPPDDPLDMNLSLLIDGRTLDEYATDQPNWVRFFFSGSAPPDTRVRANYWHDDQGNNTNITRLLDQNSGGPDTSLGNLTIVPMPFDVAQRVVGQFFVSVETPPEYSAGDQILVDWELFCDGEIVDADTIYLQRADDVFPVILPKFSVADGLGDVQNRTEDLTYVFRATAKIERDLPDSVSTLADPSPASVVFTVVPFDAETFIAQAIDPDRQPIVILEEQ